MTTSHYPVSLDIVSTAAFGKPFNAVPGHLFTMSGLEIRKQSLFESYDLRISPGQEYIIIKDLDFRDNTLSFHAQNKSFIIIGCHFASIKFRNAKCIHICLISSTLSSQLCIEKTLIRDLEITDGAIPHIQIEAESQVDHWTVHGTTIKELIGIRQSQLGLTLLNHSTAEGNLILRESACRSVAIRNYFKNITVDYQSKIEELSLFANTRENLLLTERLQLRSGATCKTMQIGESLIGQLSVEESAKIETFHVSDANIGMLIISNAELKQTVITKSMINLNMHNATTGNFFCKACECSQIAWKGEIAGRIYLDDTHINDLFFPTAVLAKDALFSVTDCQANHIVFEQLVVMGQFQFKGLQATRERKVKFSQSVKAPTIERPDLSSLLDIGLYADAYARQLVATSEEMQTYAEEQPAQLIISRSSMGKTEFIGCDFSVFELFYRNSKLLEMFFVGTALTGIIIKVHKQYNNKPKAKQDEYEQKVSIYSQLKKIFDGQGYIMEGNHFHARAMYNHQRLLRFHLRRKRQSLRERVNTVAEYLGFKLNGLSNNHGENWPRAFWFILLVTMLTFIFACYTLKYQFNPSMIIKKEGWQFLTDRIWIDNLSKLPGFFLLTHRIEYLSDGTAYRPGFAHFCWDMIGRLLIGYGIYQFISAFRRHSRKGS